MIRAKYFDIRRGQRSDEIISFFRDTGLQPDQLLFSRTIQISPGNMRAILIYDDSSPPEVAGTSPTDGAVEIPAGATITVLMSEPVTAVSGKVTVVRNGTTLTENTDYTISPVGSWPAEMFTISGAVDSTTNAQYYIVLDSSIADSAGNTMRSDVVFGFMSQR